MSLLFLLAAPHLGASCYPLSDIEKLMARSRFERGRIVLKTKALTTQSIDDIGANQTVLLMGKNRTK